MKLDKVRNIALKLMRDHGLSDYTFKWDSAVRRFGCHNGRLKYISLSRPMTQHESNDDRVINTILHEIAHALDYKKRGYSNHDSQWKKTAKSIGCNGQTCSSVGGLDQSKILKWIASCPSCEKQIYYARKSKVSKACGSCCKKNNNNKYTSEYQFNWELNPKIVKYI
jgi:predicted SprT family Zn-dependent metalloprotease|tara:strand:- start:18319 stop:18819 length:501 start_codon:yes stop_codon:yes gene_type:complete